MYNKPEIIIISKSDLDQIKAAASSTGSYGCFASGECSGNIDHAGACISTAGDYDVRH